MSLSTDYSTAKNHHHSSQLDAKNIDLQQLNADARAVLEFWFDDSKKAYWFDQNDNFDQEIKDNFSDIWQAAKSGECVSWRRSEDKTDANDSITNLAGRLAEIIVLDQFSRNLCRNQACAFAQDSMALVLAQEAITQPHFYGLPIAWRQFMIMPFMHSESLVIHERYLPLFKQVADESTLKFEQHHKEIIEEFGRYPHRNEVLDRESTTAEEEFLQKPGSSF